MSHDEVIQKAVSDLALIRRAIEINDRNKKRTAPARFTVSANLMIQTFCLLIAALMIIFEILSDRALSVVMLSSITDKDLAIWGLAQVAVSLPIIIMCIYFIAFRAARLSKQSFNDYLGTNFQYLRNTSLVSDLFTKFIPLSLLVLAGHSEWVAPILSLYIADYLIQGRYFNLPVRTSFILGLLSVLTGIAQYVLNSAQLIWPLVHFSLISTFSIAYLLRVKKNVDSNLERI
ncbi:MAG: hypothetical protein ACXVB1_13700 [Pseudobdellovibrionaceae bacterium]